MEGRRERRKDGEGGWEAGKEKRKERRKERKGSWKERGKGGKKEIKSVELLPRLGIFPCVSIQPCLEGQMQSHSVI